MRFVIEVAKFILGLVSIKLNANEREEFVWF